MTRRSLPWWCDPAIVAVAGSAVVLAGGAWIAASFGDGPRVGAPASGLVVERHTDVCDPGGCWAFPHLRLRVVTDDGPRDWLVDIPPGDWLLLVPGGDLIADCRRGATAVLDGRRVTGCVSTEDRLLADLGFRP